MIDWDEWRDRSLEDLRDILEDLDELTESILARIRLGVYSEKQDGNLQEVLEEIERILR